MSAVPQVSVVIVTFNSREHVLACLAALTREAGVPHEVLLVDNASADDTLAAVRQAHPGAPMPSEREYFEAYLKARYEGGPNRCC